MQAKPDLRVLLKWMITGSGSVITDVIWQMPIGALMQSLGELPEDPKDWADIKVDLPKLSIDTCPMPVSELLEYVNMESSEPGTATTDSLKFLRTADTGGTACWIWAYTEPDGQLCYLTYRELPDGMNIRGMASASPEWNDFRLTPEQYLLAEHYDLVYWS